LTRDPLVSDEALLDRTVSQRQRGPVIVDDGLLLGIGRRVGAVAIASFARHEPERFQLPKKRTVSVAEGLD